MHIEILEFNKNSYDSKTLAVHHANEVDGEQLISFMSGKISLRSESEALEIIKGFWRMTDLAIQDKKMG